MLVSSRTRFVLGNMADKNPVFACKLFEATFMYISGNTLMLTKGCDALQEEMNKEMLKYVAKARDVSRQCILFKLLTS